VSLIHKVNSTVVLLLLKILIHKAERLNSDRIPRILCLLEINFINYQTLKTVASISLKTRWPNNINAKKLERAYKLNIKISILALHILRKIYSGY